jgi:hypothetical protein
VLHIIIDTVPLIFVYENFKACMTPLKKQDAQVVDFQSDQPPAAPGRVWLTHPQDGNCRRARKPKLP